MADKEVSMTDPTGKSFLSYSRRRLDEARYLVAAQHEMGIPTWQDVDDLKSAPTEPALRNVLGHPSTANAILWLTAEVESSETIRLVEAPDILRRHEESDGFFVVIVAAGGLGYDEAADTLKGATGVHDPTVWNMCRTRGKRLTDRGAAEIAERVLDQRLKAIHEAIPPGEALRLRLMTRRSPGFELGWALTLDWSHHFGGGRLAPERAWGKKLLPALRRVREAIRKNAPGRRLEWTGQASLSAAMALGCAFLELDEFHVDWLQATRGEPDQLWSLDAAREPAGFVVETIPGPVAAKDLAVLLSVTADVEPALTPDLPPFRAKDSSSPGRQGSC